MSKILEMAAAVWSREQENFAKLFHLVIGDGKNALLDILVHCLTNLGKTWDEWYVENQVFFRNLPFQRQVLRNPHGIPIVPSMDITFLTSMIIPNPRTDRFRVTPLLDNLETIEAAQHLRTQRNELLHSAKLLFTDDEFTTKWDEVTEILCTLVSIKPDAAEELRMNFISKKLKSISYDDMKEIMRSIQTAEADLHKKIETMLERFEIDAFNKLCLDDFSVDTSQIDNFV